MVGDKPCFNFANGSCRFGDRCHYSQDLSSASGTASSRHGHPARGGWQRGGAPFRGVGRELSDLSPAARDIIERNPTHQTFKRPNEQGFPDFNAVTMRSSDALLPPFKALPPRTVFGRVTGMSKDDKKINTPAVAEELLLLLNAGNNTNELWVREPAWDVADEKTFEESQSLLTKCAEVPGNFVLRLSEVIRWPDVTVKGNDKTRLSFQSAYMGVIAYLTSEAALKSALFDKVNALYGLIDINLNSVIHVLKTCIDDCLDAKTFKDPISTPYLRSKVVEITSGLQVFKPVAVMLEEYVDRYRSALTTHPELPPFIQHFEKQFTTWSEGVYAGTFRDAITSRSAEDRKFMIEHVRKLISTLVTAVSKSVPLAKENGNAVVPGFTPSFGVLAALEREYDGPGYLSANGTERHDNDEVDFHEIEIPPTTDELISSAEAYMPANLPGAKHHLPTDSIDKILDIQFRLLRADATKALKVGIQMVLRELNSEDYLNTSVHKLLRTGGGRFVGSPESGETIVMPMISNLKYTGLTLDPKYGLIIQVQGDAPPGAARSLSHNKRKEYWEQGKRLQMGGLVAIVTKARNKEATVSLALLTTYPGNIKHVEDRGTPSIQFGLSFVDPAQGFMAAEILQRREAHDRRDIRLLLESPVLYEAYRPFLEAIQGLDPDRLPMADYIKHTELANTTVQQPEYARVPGFRWDLRVLLKKEFEHESLHMDSSNPLSVDSARQTLYTQGKLDHSQTDAVIDCLTREMALIQGPPGTGKTFTGVELLRLLIANNVGPIVLLAFTNHALDHILRAIHDNNVTHDMIRLGSRSKDEVVSQYSMESLENVKRPDATLRRRAAGLYGKLKGLGSDMEKVVRTITSVEPEESDIINLLKIDHPMVHLNLFEEVPDVQRFIFDHMDNVDGWETIGKRGRRNITSNTIWEFWKSGKDLQHFEYLARVPKVVVPDPISQAANQFQGLVMDNNDDESDGSVSESSFEQGSIDDEYAFMFEAPDAGSDSDSETDTDVNSKVESEKESDDGEVQPMVVTDYDILTQKDRFLAHFGLAEVPKVRQSTRSVDELLHDGDVWSFSALERSKLAEYLSTEAKSLVDEDSLALFESLVTKHTEAKRDHDEARNNIRVDLLRKVKLLGSTTTGAAKLPSVLKSFSPKVLVIEEAGQVLEAHVLATLFPSIQHIIAIGDPQQLRPTVNSYELSVDSKRGQELYRFDVSLMERLSTGGLPMSQLQVLRRMRPEISSLIRNTLYPRLVDHDLVRQYPDVRGMAKNVFFLDHRHRESRVTDGTSKSNDYEAQMATDLAVYFLRQGTYSKEGDIVILCAYLGQLLKIRAELRNRHITVLLDERDQREIDKRVEEDEEPVLEAKRVEEDEEPVLEAKRVELGRHILLRTVDNFQGEEAKTVIVSLVRNEGGPENVDGDAGRSIGFLRSNNRVNVALSRAQHGMFIMGHAPQLAARSNMWAQIIEDLSENQAVGEGWPIACARHPDDIRYVKTPGEIQLLSPDGGCMQQCDDRLPCGHFCGKKCHPDDKAHEHITCQRRCERLLQPCGHPCTGQCQEECGECEVILKNMELPCGHFTDVPCRMASSLELIPCQAVVTKPFETCEHNLEIPCGNRIEEHRCMATCGQPRDCCGRTCNAKCSDCKSLNPTPQLLSEPTEFIVEANGNLVQDAVPTLQAVTRVKHAPHECDKLLPVCGHKCRGKCSAVHQHEACKAPCLQTCDHHRCQRSCRDPCAPCKESCTWVCPHQACSLPCAMPCDRLPCDVPCQNTLRCGHQCPSVCGEDCSTQLCPTCAPAERQAEVVDFIMQATLADTVKDEPDTRFITLGCGHIFTMETLDGHGNLGEYYHQSPEGKYVSLKVPESGQFRPRPTCPTCRGPISSPRYNRVTKRALIDIQEQHAMATLAQQLSAERKRLDNVSWTRVTDGAANRLNGITIIQQAMPNSMNIEALLRLDPAETRCIPAEVFLDRLTEVFFINGPLFNAWRQVTDELIAIYKRLARVVNSDQLPHVAAHESAVSTVYREEMEMVLATSPSSSERDHTARCLMLAKRRVGAPFPRGERRFKIEALFETIKLRLRLVGVAQAFRQALITQSATFKVKKNENLVAAQRKVNILAYVLVRSCRRDSDLATNLCDKAEATRLRLTAEMLAFESTFEFTRLSCMDRVSHLSGKFPSIRQEEVDKSRVALATAAKRFNEWSASFLAGQTDDSDLVKTFNTVTLPEFNLLSEAWEAFNADLASRRFYSTVTLEEKRAIVKAITQSEWGTGGRLYQCPNGHTYSIGDCGQAMVESACPECGAQIGGQHHNLRQDNRRDLELERLATEQGALRNPHAAF